MLEHLSEIITSGNQRFTIQSIITKVDAVQPTELRETIADMKRSMRGTLSLPPILTSAKMKPPFGVDLVRANILEACGLTKMSP
jgi:GTP-binding protein